MRRALLTSLAFLAPLAVGAQGLPRTSPSAVALDSARLTAIAPLLQAWVDSGKVAGAVAVVARQGKLAYRASAGSLDSARSGAIAEDAVFRIFSMTKPIASAAVMQLVERGKVKLDDPVSKYLPSWAKARVYAGGGATQPQLRAPRRPPTIADLLTHSAGLTYGLFGNTSVDSIYRRSNLLNPAWSIAEMADSVASLPLMFDPGARFNYSVAIDVLGRIVEVASGERFDRYLEREIFAPLGMTSTAFHATPDMAARATAVFVRMPNGKLVPASPRLAREYKDEGKLLSGGGGLLSTVPDYLRFAQALLNGGTLDGKRILKQETVALMMRNHLDPSIGPVFGGLPWPVGRNGFGYGGAVRLDDDPSVPGSAGTFRWSGYASTFFWIDPKADLIAMIWTQYLPETDIWEKEGEFQRLVYGAIR